MGSIGPVARRLEQDHCVFRELDGRARCGCGDMKKTVLVTGGAGYVGSHCCKAFARAGWNVVTLDNLSRGWRDAVRWGPLVECDIRDSARVRAALETHRPDLIAHFAAFAYVGESVT